MLLILLLLRLLLLLLHGMQRARSIVCILRARRPGVLLFLLHFSMRHPHGHALLCCAWQHWSEGCQLSLVPPLPPLPLRLGLLQRQRHELFCMHFSGNREVIVRGQRSMQQEGVPYTRGGKVGACCLPGVNAIG